MIGLLSTTPGGSQRIWQRWYDHQPDKHAALREMLMQRDPVAILAAGRFQSR
ncbi:hypothetical protein U1872_03785 [Sphingomonas sp. RB3P16]|uniref:hypothetical protein n=1 Tax=Parasphingomonas frigoris TaxID=3096163 RepID=UPI002FC7C126